MENKNELMMEFRKKYPNMTIEEDPNDAKFVIVKNKTGKMDRHSWKSLKNQLQRKREFGIMAALKPKRDQVYEKYTTVGVSLKTSEKQAMIDICKKYGTSVNQFLKNLIIQTIELESQKVCGNTEK